MGDGGVKGEREKYKMVREAQFPRGLLRAAFSATVTQAHASVEQVSCTASHDVAVPASAFSAAPHLASSPPILSPTYPAGSPGNLQQSGRAT